MDSENSVYPEPVEAKLAVSNCRCPFAGNWWAELSIREDEPKDGEGINEEQKTNPEGDVHE